MWAGSVAANGQKVLDGLEWEIDRLATQTLADERKTALVLRAKAQKKLDKHNAAAGSAFLPFLRTMKEEADVRAVCRYMHYLLHRRDDAVALALVKGHNTALRRERIYANVQEMMPQLPLDARPVLNNEATSWKIPVFELSALSE